MTPRYSISRNALVRTTPVAIHVDAQGLRRKRPLINKASRKGLHLWGEVKTDTSGSTIRHPCSHTHTWACVVFCPHQQHTCHNFTQQREKISMNSQTFSKRVHATPSSSPGQRQNGTTLCSASTEDAHQAVSPHARTQAHTTGSEHNQKTAVTRRRCRNCLRRNLLAT